MARPNGVAISLAAVAALALALRLFWLANTDTETPFLSDPQYYHATASNIADGRGYGVRLTDAGFEAGPASEATAFWAPGYSAAIAIPYAVFGNDIRWAKAVNAIAGALTVMPAFFIARRLVPRRFAARAGLAAAGSVALAPALIYWTPALFSDGVFTFGVATTLALAMRARDRRRATDYLLLGVAFTATVFVRSQGVLLAVPIGVLFIEREDWSAAVLPLACVAGVAALAIVPWAGRNEIAMGEAFLISDNVCYNLRGAHAPYSTGTTVAVQDLWDEAPGISFKQRELLFDDIGCDRAWDYAREHPRRELELMPKRVGWLFRSDAEPAMRWAESLGATPIRRGDRDGLVLLGDAYWYGLLATASLSLFALGRGRPVWALLSFVAAWAAMHLVFHGEPRYHLPLVPVLAVLGVASIVTLTARVATPRSGTSP